MQTLRAVKTVLRRVHREERGAVSLETVMIVGAIAIPVLIFLLRWGWPTIRDYFQSGMENLETEANNAQNP
jgi:hypothetical protein